MDTRAPPDRVRFAGCSLDMARGIVTLRDGAETTLRPKTAELLRLFIARPGQLVTRAEILDAVWPGIFVTDDSITQCVVEIRRALGPEAGALLKTLPRRGYVLEAELEAPARVTPASARQEDRASIAVLPFRAAQGDASEAYFEDGITEGIVHLLSGLPGLFVASRGAALALAGRLPDPRDVGRELGVRCVLYGGVRRSAERVRITTELTETETGAILRADRYEGEAGDLFELQDRISVEVVSAIAGPIREAELARARRKPPASLTAYDLTLQALDRLRGLDRETFEAGCALLQEAARLDPGYAAPHSHLAYAWLFRLAQGWGGDLAADAAAAAAAADTALSLDPSDAMALAIRGAVYGYVERNYAAARHLLDQAVAVAPSFALAWTEGAALRCWLGEGAEAVVWAERGARLARFDSFGFFHEAVLAAAYLAAGDLAAAEDWARRSLASNPRHAASIRILAVALAQRGDIEAARRVGESLLRVQPDFRLTRFAATTPITGAWRDAYIGALRRAGMPE